MRPLDVAVTDTIPLAPGAANAQWITAGASDLRYPRLPHATRRAPVRAEAHSRADPVGVEAGPVLALRTRPVGGPAEPGFGRVWHAGWTMDVEAGCR